jgi:starch-binding outer membrane protein, SusD/RagB family
MKVVAAFALILAACSTREILTVEDPDIINPDAVNSPAGAAALFAGGIGEFSFAVVGDAGGTEGQILVGGSMSDELVNSETFPTRLEYELRASSLQNGTLLTIFRNLQRARVLLEASVPKLQQYSPTPASRIGESFALAGLTYVFAGENYCSGVPFSNPFPATSYGNPLTTAEIFTVAIERFDSAFAYFTAGDTGVTRRINLTRVGKARALLNRAGPGDVAAAAAEVAAVPLDFSYNTTHTITSGRQQNGVHVFTWLSERFSVANVEGTNGLNFRAAADPRVKSDRTPANNVGFDNSTPQFNPLKYPARTTSLPIANGIEAKLIIAEALLAANDASWLDTLNMLRRNLRPLGFLGPADTLASDTLIALVDPVTPAAREDLLFRERAFWLYLTGHRLGDLRRLMRQYGRLEDNVFPTGLHFKGTSYGDDVNLPVPFDELNNPNFTGCIDRLP